MFALESNCQGDVVLAAVRQNGLALQWASEELARNSELVFQAGTALLGKPFDRSA